MRSILADVLNKLECGDVDHSIDCSLNLSPLYITVSRNVFFQFNGKNYLQIHGTAMGTKMAVAFANIFMAHIETQILSKSVIKPTVWKRYIDDIFSLWDISKPDIEEFIEQAN